MSAEDDCAPSANRLMLYERRWFLEWLVRVMNKTLACLIILVAIFSSGGPVSGSGLVGVPQKSFPPDVRVTVTNRARGNWIVAAGCSGDIDFVLVSQDVKACQSADPKSFKLGLYGSTLTTLDVTKEGNFAVDVKSPDGCMRLQGSLESVTGLIPAIKQYYVYVWVIDKCPSH